MGKKTAWETMKTNASAQWDRLVGNTKEAVKAVPTGYNASKGRAHTIADATDDLRAYNTRTGNKK